jgi:hypothetical protein
MPRFSFRFTRLFRPSQWHGQPSLAAVCHIDRGLDTPALAGSGWYESSWDLTRGLSMREGLPSDAKVDEWIAVCLRS